jgi:anti-anti-sigma factor
MEMIRKMSEQRAVPHRYAELLDKMQRSGKFTKCQQFVDDLAAGRVAKAPGTPRLEIDVEYTSTSTIITYGGDFDANTKEAVKARLKEELDKGLPNLILVFTSSAFIDSSGIGLLHWLLNATRDRKISFFIAPHKGLEKSLELVSMRHLFPITPLEEALEASN